MRGQGGPLCHGDGSLRFCGNRASFRVVIAAWSITYQEVELLDYIGMICLIFFFLDLPYYFL